MAKPHWHVTYPDTDNDTTTRRHGCQYTSCEDPATWQWRRHATDTEVAAEAAVEGPYGPVYRNMQGPHYVGVFACDTHALPTDAMTIAHRADCPAPDAGCTCA